MEWPTLDLRSNKDLSVLISLNGGSYAVLLHNHSFYAEPGDCLLLPVLDGLANWDVDDTGTEIFGESTHYRVIEWTPDLGDQIVPYLDLPPDAVIVEHFPRVVVNELPNREA